MSTSHDHALAAHSELQSVLEMFGAEWRRETSDRSEAVYLTRGSIRVRLALHRAVHDRSTSDLEFTYFPERQCHLLRDGKWQWIRVPGGWALGFGEAKYTSREVASIAEASK